MTGPMTVTRTTERAAPTTTEVKVIQARIGTLNTQSIREHAPYTLKLKSVAFEDGQMTETWETVNS